MHKSGVEAQEIRNVEYFSKDKTKVMKNGKCRVEIKSQSKNKAAETPIHGQMHPIPTNHSSNNQANCFVARTDSIKHPDELNSTDKSATLSFEFCHDSFKFKIPDNVGEYEDPETQGFTIRIEFSPKNTNPAILFKPVNDKDKHKEVVALNCVSHTYNSSCIAPYIDAITEMTMYYIIPNIEEIKVVSSGTFKAIKEEDKTIIYQYTAFSNPKYFMFAVGTYDQNDLFNDTDKKKVLTPILSGHDSKDKNPGSGNISEGLSDVLSDIQAVIKYIENFTKTSELSTTNIVFTLLNVDDLVCKNMVVLKYNYISSHRDIEMAFLLRKILCECLCFQTYGFLNWNSIDSWIFYGFSGYLSDYCLRYLLGNNEFVYSYKQNKDFLIKNDVVEPPLFYSLGKEHEYNTDFFRTKSKMVFHCIESRLSHAFLQKISDSVIEARTLNGFPVENDEDAPDSQKSSIEEQKKSFTQKFIKIVKDSTGKDLKSLFDFYVFRPGLLRIKIGLQIIKKKNLVKAVITQTPTSLLPGALEKTLNDIEIKSVELEGMFDHSLAPEIENVFSYHTRTKKKKEDEDEEEDVMPLLYVLADPKRENLFDYFVEQPDYMHIEQLQEKCVMAQLEAIDSLSKKPTLATCEACERMLENSHVFYKVRIRIIRTLKSMKIESCENAYNNRENYGPNNCDEEYDGLQRLIQFFIRTRCVPNSTILKGNEFGLIQYFLQKHLVKNISHLDENNHIKRSKIVVAFLENILKFNDNSLSQFEDSWYISAVINLYGLHCCLLTTLSDGNLDTKEDDKHATSNFFDEELKDSFDDFFSSTFKKEKTKFAASSSESFIPIDSKDIVKSCINEIERFRISDMVFPSNNNVITRACLISYIRLAFYGKIFIYRCFLESLSQYPNLFSIRFVAIEGLLILFPDALPTILRMVLKETPFVIKNVLTILLRTIRCFYKPEYCEFVKNITGSSLPDESGIFMENTNNKTGNSQNSNHNQELAVKII